MSLCYLTSLKLPVFLCCQFLCKLNQTLPLIVIPDHLHPVVQAAAESVCKGPLDNGLTEEEADKWRLKMLIPKLPETLEDSSDAKIVVGGVVQVTETRLPVFSSCKFPYRNEN